MAVVWKVVNDPFVGKLAFVRVLQGTLASKSEITHGESRRVVRVGHLLKVRGKDHHEVDSLAPGRDRRDRQGR